ncbi:transcriptional regulator [Marinobacter nauticus]|uniref:transcriptional regulator n=1 Tax=Marinobacter nauticus TaxID=2743 RepID=UPI002E2E4BCF|nr:YdaS family helix-turn-helix protein [Marinobacter nauticus]
MNNLLTRLHAAFRFGCMNTLDNEIQQAGGPQALAKELGITIQRLINWRSRGRVPADMVLTYCRARSWKVTPHELRPDIYPNPTDGLPADKRTGEAA